MIPFRLRPSGIEPNFHREIMLFPQSLSPSLQKGIRFFHHPIPPLAFLGLTTLILSNTQTNWGLPCSVCWTCDVTGAIFTPGETLAVGFNTYTLKPVLLPFGNGCCQVISHRLWVSPICDYDEAYDGSVTFTLDIFPLPSFGRRDFGRSIIYTMWLSWACTSSWPLPALMRPQVSDLFTWESDFCSLRSDGWPVQFVGFPTHTTFTSRIN